MKKHLQKLTSIGLLLFVAITASHAQTLEWRLANPTFTAIDPDGAGPATGVAAFTLQIHTLSGTVSNITGLSTGWSWQSVNAMLPTGPAPVPTCGTNSVAQPSNVVMSPTLAGMGFSYNNVNQCSGSVSFTAGGSQLFDRRAVGTVDGGTLNLTTTWVDVFTVTLWAMNSPSNAGYVVINGGAGASDGAFSTYSVSDADANEYVVQSLTWGTSLLLAAGGPIPVPVRFTGFNAACSDNGTSIAWSTATEKNSSHFEVQKSADGSSWITIASVTSSSANSNSAKSYRYTDKAGGAAQYRVKQVDVDGTITYTDIVRTACNSKAFFISLYPVPAKDKLTLVIGSDKAVRTTLHVLDNNGRVVMNVPVVISKGVNNLTLNISDLAQGQYYIRGSKDGVDVNERFVVSR